MHVQRFVEWLLKNARALVSGRGTLLRFSSASAVFSATSGLLNVIIIRWVAPEDIGLWQHPLRRHILQTYSILIQSGVLNGLNRELPFLVGARQEALATRLAQTAQGVALAGSTALLAVGVVAVMVVRGPRLQLTVAVTAVLSAIALYRNYLTVTYRAGQSFEALAKVLVLETLLAVATVPLVFLLGYYGLLGRLLLLGVAGAALAYRARPMRINPRLIWRDVWTLMRVGVPVFTFGYIWSANQTLPRLILLSRGGTTLVGSSLPPWPRRERS